ncbi:16S rRNA (guanine(966)-N(2))-methyltransferase RsmD [Buchnera aphidicola]|uniref:16S rRNA (guanine(966)-N(2))-methyltransferase RsmD n=1 Tax=Buchnera aphidicola TaxID=9 RepID=UPI001650FA6E|nr:16S rRNA (guanine(966)-N(2))-methyltransferase RsmD [Buchnera aphidicola]
MKKNIIIRITGGKLNTQKIYTQRNLYMRPTTSIIREVLFNWLKNYIQQSYCLDCFSGSGILSFESVSRGASCVVSLDIKKKNVINIKNNISRLLINNIQFFHTNTLKWLKKSHQLFDIIFIDPPFYLNLVNITIDLIQKNNLLKNNSLVYIEYNIKKEVLSIPLNWTLYKIKKKKDKVFVLYKIFLKL